MGIFSVVWFVLVAGTLAVVGEALDHDTAKTVSIAVFLGSLAVVLGFFVYAYQTHALLIDVGPDGVTLDEGRQGVFPTSGVFAGTWRLARYEVTAGTALHLVAGAQRFRLGGRDHRASPGLRLDAPPTESVDAQVTAEELDVLLAGLPGLAGPAVGPPTSVRCMLAPNLGLFGEKLGVPPLVVELERDGLRVFDARSGAPVTAAHYAHVQATAAQHTYSGKSSFTMPILVIAVPGAAPFHVGIPDLRFSWSGDVKRVAAAPYVVGGADWLALVERLGLRPALKIGPG